MTSGFKWESIRTQDSVFDVLSMRHKIWIRSCDKVFNCCIGIWWLRQEEDVRSKRDVERGYPMKVSVSYLDQRVGRVAANLSSKIYLLLPTRRS